MMTGVRVSAALAAGVWGVLPAGRAQAQTTLSWSTAASGNWAVPTNWTPNGVPNNVGPSLFNANISVAGAAYTITLDQNITVENMDLASIDARVDLGNFDLAVRQDYTQTNGLLFGGGTGTFTTDGVVTFNNATVRGISNFQSRGTLIFNGAVADLICDTGIGHSGAAASWIGTGDLVLDRGAVFTNQSTSTFTISNDRQLRWNTNGARPTFRNEGTLVKSTGGGVTFITDVNFDNTGTVRVSTGTLRADLSAQVVGSTFSGGTWRIESGATLDLVGANLLTNSADVTLDGVGSTFAAIDGLSTNSTTGRFAVSGTRDFTTTGTFTNDGTIVVGAGSAFRVAPGSSLTNYTSGTRTLSGGTYDVDGLVRVDGLDVQTLNAAVTLRGAASDLIDPVGGVSGVRNLAAVGAAGSFGIDGGRNFQSVADFTVAPGGELAVGAGSLFRVAPGSTLTNFAAGVFLDGGFEIEGTLQFDDAAVTTVGNAVTLTGAGPRIIDQFGNDAFSQLATIQPAGDVSVRVGNSLSLSTLSLDGRLGIDAGPASVPTIVAVTGDLTQAPGGVLDLDRGGELRVTGNLALNGTVRGNGTINGSPVVKGIIEPGRSPGLLLVSGTFALDPDALVNIEIGGVGGTFDQIIVSADGPLDGSLTLGTGNPATPGGTMAVAFLGLAAPVPGDRYDVLIGTALHGRFAQITGLDLGNGLWLEAIYSPDRLTLVVVPAPASLAGVLGLLGCRAGRRRRA